MSSPPFEIPRVWFHSTEMDPDELAQSISLAVDPMGVVSGNHCEIWFSDCWHASRYFGPNTVRATLSLANPLLVTSEEFAERGIGPSSGWARKARSEGYDSVIIHDIMDGDAFSTVCAIFDPALADTMAHSRWNEAAQDFDLL